MVLIAGIETYSLYNDHGLYSIIIVLGLILVIFASFMSEDFFNIVVAFMISIVIAEVVVKTMKNETIIIEHYLDTIFIFAVIFSSLLALAYYKRKYFVAATHSIWGSFTILTAFHLLITRTAKLVLFELSENHVKITDRYGIYYITLIIFCPVAGFLTQIYLSLEEEEKVESLRLVNDDNV